MNSEVSPLPGWRIDDAKLVASIRWHRSWPGFHLFAVVWNLGLPLKVHAPQSFTIVGYLAAVAFGLLALRSLFSRTTMRFDARHFTVETPLAFWQRLDVPLADIDSFQPETRMSKITDVMVHLKSNTDLDLPADWQPLSITTRGSEKRLFVAKPEDAQWLADMLNQMLANARQLGHDTYRT